MIAELGHFALILALFFAMLLAIVPTLGLATAKMTWISTAPYYVVGQFIFIAIAYLCLSLSFLQNDFTVSYVANNSSLSLPDMYKLCAVWGGHEGSMLLWIAILSLWMLFVTIFSKQLEEAFRTRVLVVLGALSVGFILFLLLTSNPFQRFFQNTSTGQDLNPLLQDPGFLFHPPMLYMGYVGFAVAFAFAIAALWLGKVESTWTKWARPWTLAAWCCLTAGITLGSWWAYRELGWGGWWFWDPVENASFMPWLVGTALLHSLMVSEKRQQFMAWTLLLAIIAFSLSLIGTFLVRSGILTSVHAFAVDPARGIYILGFLLLVIGGAFLLFAMRAHSLTRQESPALISRETALLLNNVFLMVIMLTVLLGTLYPLLIDALGLGKLSVGAPYFNAVFVPLVLPLLLLMGFGIHLNWQRDLLKKRARMFLLLLLFSVLIPGMLLYALTDDIKMYTFLGLVLASWVILSCLKLLQSRIQQHGIKAISQAFSGMLMAHCGVAVTVIGVALSTGYGIQDDVRMSLGDSVVLSTYRITFLGEAPLHAANYHGIRASFSVGKVSKSDAKSNVAKDKQSKIKLIYPEKRIYDVGQMAMTDSAIDVNPFRDIYVALGESLGQSTWSVRLYFKPFVRWIWAGGFMVFLGGILALTDRRYYRSKS